MPHAGANRGRAKLANGHNSEMSWRMYMSLQIPEPFAPCWWWLTRPTPDICVSFYLLHAAISSLTWIILFPWPRSNWGTPLHSSFFTTLREALSIISTYLTYLRFPFSYYQARQSILWKVSHWNVVATHPTKCIIPVETRYIASDYYHQDNHQKNSHGHPEIYIVNAKFFIFIHQNLKSKGISIRT